MGIYLNPGNRRFEIAMNSKIFVDKTEMICYLNTLVNTNQRYVSVSRPRRFGKTMAADMICAYYDRTVDSRGLFEQTLLPKNTSGDEATSMKIPWDQYLGKFDVIRIVMTEFMKKDTSVSAGLKRLEKRIMDEFNELYPGTKYDPEDFNYSMEKFFRMSGNPVVVIIDEWDAVFRNRKEDKDGQIEYLNFLRDWMKDKEYIALAYMTGILPIKKYGEHSALNMFVEYSMAAPMQLAKYTGFTEKEVQDLCEKYGRDYGQIKDWYDGYIVRDIIPPDPYHKQFLESGVSPKAHIYSLYSPFSVINATITGMIKNYWNSTETYNALAEYIRLDYFGLKETVALLMNGGRVQVNLSTYQNDMTTFHSRDDVLALLIHLGYCCPSD